MALVSIASLDASEARIVLPRIGAWHVDATLQGATGIEEGDAVTVSVAGSLSLVGHATRAQAHEDALRVRVVAGGAGLAGTATAKFYQGAQVRLVLGDLLTGAGEMLSSTADAAILATLLPNWSTFARPVGVEIATLLSVAPVGTAWRVLADGSVWVGPETWPVSSLAFELIERDPARKRLVLGVALPTLLPGFTLDGERIGDVEHVVTAAHVTTIARLA